jgi:TatD DNase family protein
VKLETLPAVIGLAERHANLFASVGVHPTTPIARSPTRRGCLRSQPIPKWWPLAKRGWTTTGTRTLPNGSVLVSDPHPRRPALRQALIIHTRTRPPTPCA